ncbi:hypothetical protein TNCV_4262911 [Trichonephila clavipes]|nr:hypothetical protein TNCV_4262911 [Trichonephila clavipes]
MATDESHQRPAQSMDFWLSVSETMTCSAFPFLQLNYSPPHAFCCKILNTLMDKKLAHQEGAVKVKRNFTYVMTTLIKVNDSKIKEKGSFISE